MSFRVDVSEEHKEDSKNPRASENAEDSEEPTDSRSDKINEQPKNILVKSQIIIDKRKKQQKKSDINLEIYE